MLEHQEALQKERESFKGKIHNLEAKCREAESKRTTLMFDLEKEKAGYGLKQDHMQSQLNDAHESIKRFERKVETLTRDNARLKNENRTTRKFMYGSNNPNGGYLTNNT